MRHPIFSSCRSRYDPRKRPNETGRRRGEKAGEKDGLGIRSINDTYAWDFVAHLYNFEGVTFTPIEDGAELPEEGGNWDVDEVDLDEIAELFQYDGMPPTVIYESEEVDVFRWLFDGISGFMDFIAGMIISIIKMPILGFTGMLEDFVDSMLTGLN